MRKILCWILGHKWTEEVLMYRWARATAELCERCGKWKSDEDIHVKE